MNSFRISKFAILVVTSLGFADLEKVDFKNT
jgi:hypothetical protein